MRTPRLKDALDFEGLDYDLFHTFAELFKVKDSRRTETIHLYAAFVADVKDDDKARRIIQKWSEHAFSVIGTQPSDSTIKTFLKFFCHLRDGEEQAATRELMRHWGTINPGQAFPNDRLTRRHDDNKQPKGKKSPRSNLSNNRTRRRRAQKLRASSSLLERNGRQVASDVDISAILEPPPMSKPNTNKSTSRSSDKSHVETIVSTHVAARKLVLSAKPPKNKAGGGSRVRGVAEIALDGQPDRHLTDKPNKSQPAATSRITVTHCNSPEPASSRKQDKSRMTVSLPQRRRGRSSTTQPAGKTFISPPQGKIAVAALPNESQETSAFTGARTCMISIPSRSIDGRAPGAQSGRSLGTNIPHMDRAPTSGLSAGKKKAKTRAASLMPRIQVNDSIGELASGQAVRTPGVKMRPSVKELTLSKSSHQSISHSLEGAMREIPSDVPKRLPAICRTVPPMSRVSVEQQTVCLPSAPHVDHQHPDRTPRPNSVQTYVPHAYQETRAGHVLEKAELTRPRFQQMNMKEMTVKTEETSASFTLHSKPTRSKRQRLSSVASAIRKRSENRLSFKAPQRPPLSREPPIWATSRQEICETLDYFRSYQSGVYSSDGLVKGYLLSAFGSERDIFHLGGRFIVSHGGGKSESVLQSRVGARHQLAGDQKITDRSVRALMRNYEESRPLVLLADDKYDKFPYDLSTPGSVYPYIVLGFFWIPYAWAEYEAPSTDNQSVVRWKFAFQWCEEQGDPWWTSSPYADEAGATNSVSNFLHHNEKPSSTIVSPGKRFRFRDEELCIDCMKTSPSVYKQGWICLNPCCGAFWTLKHGGSPTILDYSESFLQLISPTHPNISLANLKPSLISEAPDGIATGLPFSKGWHCKGCGRLACRSDWKCWKCPHCNKEHQVEDRSMAPHEFWLQRPSRPIMHAEIGRYSGIRSERPAIIHSTIDGRDEAIHRLTYVLPMNRGKIHLVLGNPRANSRANEAFRLYQEEAKSGGLELRRYALRTHRLRGPMLTNYFSQNSGEPYQYVSGTGQTVPFDKASKSVIAALAIIKERTQKALGCEVPFNEILTAAYMESQKMSFHSDSEIGLGPVVASLSLGSMAYMHFRMKNSQQREKRSSQIDLTLTLRHGDVVVMEGAQVQDLYEHTVSPVNFRIAATARCIGPNHSYYKT